MTKDEYGDFVLRYKGCGACFPMYHTLSRFEKMWFTAIQKDVAELENKIADIKANCDLAIEGRDIKIKELELELTVEKDQHQEEINLHLHAEEYIKKLEKENNKLLDVINNQDVKIADLEQQIERAVDIIRDLGSTVREGVTCHYLVDNGGLHRATLFIKEIKEND